MVTEAQVRSTFDKLNQLYFDNELPQPNKIAFPFVKRFLGEFIWRGYYTVAGSHNNAAHCTLNISSAWNMTDFEVEKVIIHEMVHEWQWVHGYTDHHGKTFRSKAAHINKLTNNKYAIARKTAIADNCCLKDICKRAYDGVVILYTTKRNPGQQYIAVCPMVSYRNIKSWFPKHNDIISCKFYLGHGKELNSIKKSVRKVHGYEYTEKFEHCLIKEL